MSNEGQERLVYVVRETESAFEHVAGPMRSVRAAKKYVDGNAGQLAQHGKMRIVECFGKSFEIKTETRTWVNYEA